MCPPAERMLQEHRDRTTRESAISPRRLRCGASTAGDQIVPAQLPVEGIAVKYDVEPSCRAVVTAKACQSLRPDYAVRTEGSGRQVLCAFHCCAFRSSFL